MVEVGRVENLRGQEGGGQGGVGGRGEEGGHLCLALVERLPRVHVGGDGQQAVPLPGGVPRLC